MLVVVDKNQLQLQQQKISDKNFYLHQIEGYEAYHEVADGPVVFGKVVAFYKTMAHPIAVIDPGQKEVPLVDDFIEKVDHDEKKIYFQLPEGLLEI